MAQLWGQQTNEHFPGFWGWNRGWRGETQGLFRQWSIPDETEMMAICCCAFFNTHGIVHFNLVSLFYVNYTSVKLIEKTILQGWGVDWPRAAGRCLGSWEALSQHHLNLPAAAARECLCFNALATDPDTHWPFQTTVLITHSHLAPCSQARTSVRIWTADKNIILNPSHLD